MKCFQYFLIIFVWSGLVNSKLTAAQIIQKAGRGFVARKNLSFDQILKNVPYPAFRDLICLGDYITQTDWLYLFIEMKENKKLFKRDDHNNIDISNLTMINKEYDEDAQDAFFHKYLVQFHAACYRIFADRATDEILQNRMSWSQAVSSMDVNGQPKFPIIYTRHAYGVDTPVLVLGQIFNEVYEHLFYAILWREDTERWGTPYPYDWFTNYPPQLWNATEEERGQNMVQYQLYRYCIYLGRDLNFDIWRMNENWLVDINFGLAARQTFQLGRLLFENQDDAFEQLGGEGWLHQQPTVMMQIIRNHLLHIQQPKDLVPKATIAQQRDLQRRQDDLRRLHTEHSARLGDVIEVIDVLKQH